MSWNVDGLNRQELDVLLDHVIGSMEWDILMLQESFHATGELTSSRADAIYTTSDVIPHVGCPAVIVHPRWAGASAFEGSGSHWVAIRIAGVVVLSVYLPRAGREHLFEEVLGEVASFLEARPADRFIIGTDANTHVGAHVDHVAIGPHVPGHLGRQAYERRADLFHEFLHEHNLMLTNTFADREVNDDQTVFTRLDPAGRGASQIDFIAASRSLPAVSVGVDTDVFFKTDHRPILATFALRARAAVKRKGCPLNWRPNEAWVGAAVANTWNWADWKAGREACAQLAARHRERPARAIDEALGALIAERRAAPAAQRREVGRRIYRHPRRLKKIIRADELLSAAARGPRRRHPKRRTTSIGRISLGMTTPTHASPIISRKCSATARRGTSRRSASATWTIGRRPRTVR